MIELTLLEVGAILGLVSLAILCAVLFGWHRYEAWLLDELKKSEGPQEEPEEESQAH